MDKNFEIKLRTFIRELYYKEYQDIEEDDDIDEITTTGDIQGYSTPYAFADDEEERKKKLKPALRATGYELVKENIDKQDLAFLKQFIRKEVASILRDIWIKRTAWA